MTKQRKKLGGGGYNPLIGILHNILKEGVVL